MDALPGAKPMARELGTLYILRCTASTPSVAKDIHGVLESTFSFQIDKFFKREGKGVFESFLFWIWVSISIFLPNYDFKIGRVGVFCGVPSSVVSLFRLFAILSWAGLTERLSDHYGVGPRVPSIRLKNDRSSSTC